LFSKVLRKLLDKLLKREFCYFLNYALGITITPCPFKYLTHFLSLAIKCPLSTTIRLILVFLIQLMFFFKHFSILSELTFKKFDRNPEVLSAYHSFEGEQERLRNLNLRYVITPFLLLHQKMNPPKLFFCRTLSLIFPKKIGSFFWKGQ
jgi:hypothetical protein